MPRGILFEPDIETAKKILIDCKGIVSYAAQRMKIQRHTLQRFIDRTPEVKELLHDLRFNYDEEQLDGAQNVLNFAIANKDKDLSNALKAAIFLLNQKGKSRGFAHPNYTPDTLGTQLEEFNKNMKDGYAALFPQAIPTV